MFLIWKTMEFDAAYILALYFSKLDGDDLCIKTIYV